MSRLRSSWADILPTDDAIEYVMDEIDAMRCKPPSDGIITVSVCCHDLQFAGPRQDSRVKLTLAWGAGEKVFASTVQRSTVSPVFAESFRFSGLSCNYVRLSSDKLLVCVLNCFWLCVCQFGCF